jgi:hypothetical protein
MKKVTKTHCKECDQNVATTEEYSNFIFTSIFGYFFLASIVFLTINSSSAGFIITIVFGILFGLSLKKHIKKAKSKPECPICHVVQDVKPKQKITTKNKWAIGLAIFFAFTLGNVVLDNYLKTPAEKEKHEIQIKIREATKDYKLAGKYLEEGNEYMAKFMAKKVLTRIEFIEVTIDVCEHLAESERELLKLETTRLKETVKTIIDIVEIRKDTEQIKQKESR